MLEWMQRHKKYLVVTIWISVIALVAAGMVGWNPSSFSLSGDNVAKVGDIKITIQEFQNAYQRTFNEYNQMLGGNLDLEQAKAFGLDKIALKTLIQRAQLQNFANDLGLVVSDNEVIETITQDENFKKDGIFDEKLYRSILKENHLSVKFFEQSVKTSLLIQKLFTLFPASITTLEQQSIALGFGLSDTIEYAILRIQPLQQAITQEQIEAFWEKHKEQFVNKKQVTLQAYFVAIDEQTFKQEELEQLYNEDKTLYLDSTGQLLPFEKVKDKVQYDFQSQSARKQAAKLNQKLKTEGLDEPKTITLTLDEKISQELLEQLQEIQKDSFLKPAMYDKNHYIIGKVSDIKPQSIKTLQEAKAEVVVALTKDLQFQELKAKAQATLKNFQGKITHINPSNQSNIEGLDSQEAQFVIKNIFESTQQQGVIYLDKIAFLYKITKQDLPKQIPNDLIEIVRNVKSQYLDKTLSEYLSKKYSIKIYNQNLE